MWLSQHLCRSLLVYWSTGLLPNCCQQLSIDDDTEIRNGGARYLAWQAGSAASGLRRGPVEEAVDAIRQAERTIRQRAWETSFSRSACRDVCLQDVRGTISRLFEVR